MNLQPNDIYLENKDVFLSEQIEEAMEIMYNSIKTGRPLFQFKRWDFLDYEAKQRALKETDFIKSAVIGKVSLDEAREIAGSTLEDVK